MNFREIKLNLEYEGFAQKIDLLVHYLNILESAKNGNYDITLDNSILSQNFIDTKAFVKALSYMANNKSVDVDGQDEFNTWFLANKDRIIDPSA